MKKLLSVLCAAVILLAVGCKADGESAVSQASGNSEVCASSVASLPPNEPPMWNSVDFTFADLGENAWEVKRLTYDDYGFHIEDAVGVIRVSGSCDIKLDDYKDTGGIEMTQRGSGGWFAEDMNMNGLIFGALRGFVAHGGGNGQAGIIEYHGYFYYYDGPCYDHLNGAGDFNIYPLSVDVFTDDNSWTASGTMKFSSLCYKIHMNWVGFKGETPTGIETGFEEKDDIGNYN